MGDTYLSPANRNNHFLLNKTFEMRGGFATLLALAAMAEGFTKPEKYVAFTGTGKIKQSGTKTWVVNGEFEVEAVTRNAAIKKARALHEKRHCYSFDGLPIKCELL